jgi:hypothetical protein
VRGHARTTTPPVLARRHVGPAGPPGGFAAITAITAITKLTGALA